MYIYKNYLCIGLPNHFRKDPVNTHITKSHRSSARSRAIFKARSSLRVPDIVIGDESELEMSIRYDELTQWLYKMHKNLILIPIDFCQFCNTNVITLWNNLQKFKKNNIFQRINIDLAVKYLALLTNVIII